MQGADGTVPICYFSGKNILAPQIVRFHFSMIRAVWTLDVRGLCGVLPDRQGQALTASGQCRLPFVVAARDGVLAAKCAFASRLFLASKIMWRRGELLRSQFLPVMPIEFGGVPNAYLRHNPRAMRVYGLFAGSKLSHRLPIESAASHTPLSPLEAANSSFDDVLKAAFQTLRRRTL
jgi:hypothetical protein